VRRPPSRITSPLSGSDARARQPGRSYSSPPGPAASRMDLPSPSDRRDSRSSRTGGREERAEPSISINQVNVPLFRQPAGPGRPASRFPASPPLPRWRFEAGATDRSATRSQVDAGKTERLVR
jgi:hypothetical protein